MPDDPCTAACQDALDGARLAVSQVENLLATTGLLGIYDPDFVSYDVGVFPAPAPEGTVGAYFPVSGVLQLLRSVQLLDDPTPAWETLGLAVVLENNQTAHLRSAPYTVSGGTGTLAAALARISSGGTLIVDAPYTVTTTATIPENVEVQFVGGGRFSVGSGRTLTILGTVQAARVPIFAGIGAVRLPGAAEIYLEWFGAVRGGPDCAPAIRAALAASGTDGPTVKLRSTSDGGGGYHVASEVEMGVVGQSLHAEGGHTLLIASTQGMRSILFLNANHLSVSNVITDGARKAIHGILARRTYYGRIDRPLIANTLSDGLRFMAGYDSAPIIGNNDACVVTDFLSFDTGTFYVTPSVRARYDQDYYTTGSYSSLALADASNPNAQRHGRYVQPHQVSLLPAGTTASITAGSHVITFAGAGFDATTLGLRMGDPIAVGNGGGSDATDGKAAADLDLIAIGNGGGSYDSPLAASSYAHAVILSVDSPTQITCMRAFDATATTSAVAIGRGDAYREDRFNDNNLIRTDRARAVHAAGFAFSFDGLFGMSAHDLWCDYGPFSAVRVGGQFYDSFVHDGRIAKVYVEAAVAGHVSYASQNVLTVGVAQGLEVTNVLDHDVPTPIVYHASGAGGEVSSRYSTGSYSHAGGIKRIGRDSYTSEIPLSAAVHAGPPPGPAFAVGAPGGPAYLNGWTAFGEGFATAMGRIALGRVVLDGMMRPGLVGAAAFQLPVGFRPAQQQLIRIASTSGAGFAFVSADGTVSVDATGTTFVGFSGASFPLG